jgi:hypothetical protein
VSHFVSICFSADRSFKASSDTDKTAKAHVATIVLEATSYIRDADVRGILLDVARYARSLENQLASGKRPSSVSGSSSVSSPLSTASSPSPAAVIKEEENDSFVIGILTERFDRFRMESDLDRYFGKSSHFELINTAIGVKSLAAKDPPEKKLPPAKRPLFWRSPVRILSLKFERS